MAIEITEEDKQRLTPEELETLRKAIAHFEAQAARPKKPNGMRRDKTDFPIGIYDVDVDEEPPTPIYDNPLR
jgi:hypothetical protein